MTPLTETHEGWSKMASPTTSPCAACKFLRRKCQPECVFAPYFPPDQPAKFSNVHKVFGASNVTKLLNELHPHQREDAVNSLAYEADMRLRDPVYGCVGVISILQHQLRQLQMDLTCAKSELSKYQSLGLITGGAGGGSAVGLGLGREQFFGGGGRHDHHQQMVMRSYDMEMARFGAYDAGLLAVNMSPAGIGTLAPLSQQPRAGGDDRLCMGPS